MRTILLLVSSLIYSQTITITDHKYYTINYSQLYKQPIYVEYEVVNKTNFVCHRKNSFYYPDSITTAQQIDFKDYDRGHIMSYESVCSNDTLAKFSFNYVNIAIQTAKLNRGKWKQTENFERTLSGKVTAKVWITFGRHIKYTPINHVAIPKCFIKELYSNDSLIKSYTICQ